jgi:hypothetical protein
LQGRGERATQLPPDPPPPPPDEPADQE